MRIKLLSVSMSEKQNLNSIKLVLYDLSLYIMCVKIKYRILNFCLINIKFSENSNLTMKLKYYLHKFRINISMTA